MKRGIFAGALAVALAAAVRAPAFAQGGDDDLRRRVDQLEKELDAMKRERGEPAPVEAKEEKETHDPKAERTGLYRRLRHFTRNVYVGGYMDIIYKNKEAQKPSGFDQARLIPYIFADVNEWVSVATEIEFEHGGPQENQKKGEVKVEFAVIDIKLDEAFNVRAGAILLPLGKFNLVHDSPVNDLTDRPLVDRSIIPTTFTESGAGFFGTLYPTELSRLDYEVYVVNGFTLLDRNGTHRFNVNDPESGLRSGRGSLKEDSNGELAGVGRVAFSPFLGFEVGASSHVGRYDEAKDNTLWIWAIDAHWQWGPLELLGEVARAEIKRDRFAKLKGVPDDSWGGYAQANYHFMPGFIQSLLPTALADESTFTAVFRWNFVELDDRRTYLYEIGLNFRPTEETALKMSYQMEDRDQAGTKTTSPVRGAFVASMATYF